MRKFILLLGMCLLSINSYAAPMNKQEQAYFNILKKELLVSSCVIQKDAKAYSGKSTNYGTISVITVSAEGCGGGNNWASYYQVFYNDGKSYFPSEALPVIDNVTVHENIIRFQSTEYAEDDPRCCPSLKKQTVFKIEGNKLLAIKAH